MRVISAPVLRSTLEDGQEKVKDTILMVKVKRKCGRPRNPIPRHKRKSHINAEHRRRGKIQDAFRTLNGMVPRQKQILCRASKADILFKAMDHCKFLQEEMKDMNIVVDALLLEKESLSLDIQVYKMLTGTEDSHVSNEQKPGNVTLDKFYNDYIKELKARSKDNQNFNIFTMLVCPLFNSFKMAVINQTADSFASSVLNWVGLQLTPAKMHAALTSECLVDQTPRTKNVRETYIPAHVTTTASGTVPSTPRLAPESLSQTQNSSSVDAFNALDRGQVPSVPVNDISALESGSNQTSPATFRPNKKSSVTATFGDNINPGGEYSIQTDNSLCRSRYYYPVSVTGTDHSEGCDQLAVLDLTVGGTNGNMAFSSRHGGRQDFDENSCQQRSCHAYQNENKLNQWNSHRTGDENDVAQCLTDSHPHLHSRYFECHPTPHVSNNIGSTPPLLIHYSSLDHLSGAEENPDGISSHSHSSFSRHEAHQLTHRLSNQSDDELALDMRTCVKGSRDSFGVKNKLIFTHTDAHTYLSTENNHLQYNNIHNRSTVSSVDICTERSNGGVSIGHSPTHDNQSQRTRSDTTTHCNEGQSDHFSRHFHEGLNHRSYSSIVEGCNASYYSHSLSATPSDHHHHSYQTSPNGYSYISPHHHDVSPNLSTRPADVKRENFQTYAYPSQSQSQIKHHDPSKQQEMVHESKVNTGTPVHTLPSLGSQILYSMPRHKPMSFLSQLLSRSTFSTPGSGDKKDLSTPESKTRTTQEQATLVGRKDQAQNPHALSSHNPYKYNITSQKSLSPHCSHYSKVYPQEPNKYNSGEGSPLDRRSPSCQRSLPLLDKRSAEYLPVAGDRCPASRCPPFNVPSLTSSSPNSDQVHSDHISHDAMWSMTRCDHVISPSIDDVTQADQLSPLIEPTNQGRTRTWTTQMSPQTDIHYNRSQHRERFMTFDTERREGRETSSPPSEYSPPTFMNINAERIVQDIHQSNARNSKFKNGASIEQSKASLLTSAFNSMAPRVLSFETQRKHFYSENVHPNADHPEHKKICANHHFDHNHLHTALVAQMP